MDCFDTQHIFIMKLFSKRSIILKKKEPLVYLNIGDMILGKFAYW